MTQLDLPQLSLQRYFDLLKRRRWQVVPVSLLGLLVGGLVAFLIPRYFVAEIRLTYQSAPGEAPAGNAADPMAALVENAKLTIPEAVDATLQQLGWPEASVLRGKQRDDFIRALRLQIEVTNATPSRDSAVAVLHLSYKNRDGVRAKDFLDKLVATWVDRELQSMRERAGKRQQRAMEQLKASQQAFEGRSEDLRALEQTFGLPANGDEAAGRESVRAGKEQAARQDQRIAELTGTLAALAVKLQHLQEQMERTPRQPTDLADLDPSLVENEEIRKMLVMLKLLRKQLLDLGPAHPARKGRMEELAELEPVVKAALAAAGSGSGQDLRLQKLQEERQQALGAEAEAKAELQTLQQQQQQLLERLAREPGAWDQHRRLTEQMRSLQQDRDRMQLELSEARNVAGRLADNNPIETGNAWVPATPTDPNILLIALIGCVIGLGVAIGLILLIDVLQGTYKTIDDVERGLSLPVLGGMSHLETVENKARVRSGRRRASLLAGAFVVLMSTVVTWYYVAPTSLPPVVRDLLAMVLGQG